MINLRQTDIQSYNQSDLNTFHSIRAELTVNVSYDIILRGYGLLFQNVCSKERYISLMKAIKAW